MNHLQIERAEKLDDMLRAFRLEPLDERELSRFYCDKTMAIRTSDQWNSPLDDLFDACTTPLVRNAHILLGHRGCGKSTELHNLKKRFEGVGQLVQVVDIETEGDIFQVNCWDIMLMITEGLCEIAKNSDLHIPDKTLKAVFDYLKKDVAQIEESNGSKSIGVEVGAEARTPSLLNVLKVFASIKSEMKVSSSMRTIITETMERRASEWIGYIMEISGWIIDGMSGKQPVLIFENIDKIQPPEKAFDIFCYSVLAQMPFPVIYTFPISLYYDPRFSSIKDIFKPHILPMIKVSNIDRSENIDGINIIRDIIELRADINLFDDNALIMLIKQTGGVLRDLFICITSAARRASRRGANKIEEEDAKRVLTELKSELTRQITRSDYPMLANIYNNQKYKEQIEDVQFLLKKMQALVVLEYNGDRWHELHPLIAQFLIDHGEIKIEQGVNDDSVG